MGLEQIGKYKILGKIGQGAMGEVYKAHDPVLNRLVAIKTISASLGADDLFRKRFQREAQSAAQLNHPNIITIYDFAETPAGVYMAMELLEGKDLRDAIARKSLTCLEERLHVVEQICEGLAFAHGKGVIHRDLKPANVHLSPTGVVKILDFGLARLGASEMTATGTVMGTPNYMSPEQVRGEKVDARSDIFSLGAVFYEVVSGHKPFDAASMHAILYQVLEGDPEPLHRWVPEVPGALADIVTKALSKDPGARYPDVGQMREALRVARRDLSADVLERTLLEGATGDATVLEKPSPPPHAAPRAARATSAPAAHRKPMVTGATALNVEPALGSDPARTARPTPTVLGAEPATRAGVRGRSRAPLYAGGAAALVALVAGATSVYLKTRGHPAGPTLHSSEAAQEQVGALTEALVSGQVELARADFDNKNYLGAIQQADKALKVDRANSSAREVRDQAAQKLRDLDQAVGEARAALDGGDTDKASRALSAILAIDPRHPAAGQLSAALNRHFRGQAEDARRIAREARAAAEATKVSSSEAFAQAAKLVAAAETLFQSQEYAVAAQKFLESRDSFERARRTAEAAARQPAPRTATASAPAPAPAAVQGLPTTTMVVPSFATPTSPPEAASAPAPLPVTPPPAPVRTAPTPGQDALVRRVIADYGRAIETRDLDLYKSVKPNLSSEEEKRLRESFRAIRSQQVAITVQGVEGDASAATARVMLQYTVDGRTMKPIAQTFYLARGPGGAWTIQSIGQ